MFSSNRPAGEIHLAGFSVLHWLQAGLAVIVLVYVSVRLFTVPFTIDEAITFTQFVSKGLWWPDPVLFNANNHMLNTLLCIWSCKLFGLNEFALRLPNLLAASVYFFYAFAWSERLTSGWSRLLLFIGLVSPHFLLDFFGLSRGYGLSMALILASWFHLGRWWQQTLVKDLVALLVFGALAAFANLSLLLPVLVGVGLVVLALLCDAIHTRAYRPFQWFLAIALGAMPLYLLSSAAFLLKEGGHLYYGAGYGFWNVTAQSLMVAVFGELETVMVYFAPVALIAAWVLLLLSWIRSGQLLWRTGGAFLLLLMVVSVVGHVVMNLLLDVNFPSDRVAIYLIPLSVLVIMQAVEVSRMDSASRMLSKGLFVILWAIPVSSLPMINLTHTRLWKWDSGVRDFFTHIVESKQELGFQPTVVVNGLQMHSLMFYNTIGGMPRSSVHTHIHGSHIADFMFSSAEIETRAELAEYDPVLQYATTGNTLYRRKKLRERVPVLARAVQQSGRSEEFTIFFSQTLDTLKGKDLLIEVTFDIAGWQHDQKMFMVLDTYDEDERNQGYWSSPLEILRENHDQPTRIVRQFILPGSLLPIHYAKLYLWNTGGNAVDVSKAEIQVWWLRG